jgi:hypothetical protein
MTSNDVQLIALEPFVSKFTLKIIKNIRAKRRYDGEKFTIHSDLVPKFSENIMYSSMGEKISKKEEPEIKKIVVPIREQPHPKNITRKTSAPTARIAPPSQNFPQQNFYENQDIFGQINLLFNDPSVSVIECKGAGVPINIVRNGQVQMTRIFLDEEDIYDILEHISEEAGIPLVEGVFRVVFDNFSINAITSNMIGSKFIIRKPNF